MTSGGIAAFLTGALLSVAAGLLPGTTAAALAGTQDATAAIVCQRAKAVRGESRALARGTTVGVTGDQQARLRRPRTLCLPAVLAGETPPALADGLQSWELRIARADARGGHYGEPLALETALGPVAGSLRALGRLLAPVGVAAGGDDPPSAPPGAPLACHRLRGEGAGGTLTLATALGTFDLRLDVARSVCLPSGDAAGTRWVCHRARPLRGARATRGLVVATRGAYGDAVLRLGPVADVCVPARGAEPGVTLRIDPPMREIEWRATGDFRVFAERPGGTSEDVTARVTWTVGDPSIAALAEENPAPGRFFGREPGTTTLVARDPVTGAEAGATLDVAWTLERLELAPSQVNRVVGESQGFQATGVFASGATHNVTPRLAWSSSDPTIAAPESPSAPSRMRALRFGTATISACDPRTGICADADATMHVLGALQSVEVFPQTTLAIPPGASVRFTARGTYADGRTRNLTQHVEWIVEEPGVARALNEDGDRSRIDGLAPGVAVIRARDPQTGYQSFPYVLYVIGDLVGIDVHPLDAVGDVIRGNGHRRYTAIGRFVGGGTKNLTQDVVWHSRDTAIAAAPNTPGDRSRIDTAGGSGTAAIYAEDPATGIVSNDALFRVLGQLTSLGIRPIVRQLPPFNRVPVGAAIRYNVWGTFSTGETLNMGRFFPDGYTLVSSDPSIAEVIAPNQLRGVAVGIAMVRAVDTLTGIESPPQELLVQGGLERLVPNLYLDRLFVGGATSVDAKGHFAPGVVLEFRAPLVFASSDESVATVAPSALDPRFGVVTAVGPGTATISVTDPATGVTSTATGDDDTITVFPNVPPARVVVTPPVATIPVDGFEDFTAVAEYANGQTLNVTQDALWATGDDAVAEVRSYLNGRSRTFGTGAGVTTVKATWNGVSSTASGHDATALVSPVVAFTVFGAEPPLAVGAEREVRVKVRLASGRELDVTSQLQYAALDVGIADFLDDEAPNRVTGIGPGTVALDLGFPDSTVRTGATLTVVGDGGPTTTTTTLPGGSASGAFVE